MELHEKLQALRRQRGCTQEELSRRLYVSRTAVSKWESGRGIPGIDSLKAISQVFGVSIDSLLSGEELLGGLLLGGGRFFCFLAAAGKQAQNHAASKQQGNQLFHSYSSFSVWNQYSKNRRKSMLSGQHVFAII